MEKLIYIHLQRMKNLQSVYDKNTGQHNVLGILISELNEQLRQYNVVGQSEQFKCLKCKNYSVKVANEKGVTSRVCNAKINDPRVIVNLGAPNCTDYVYGW